MFGTVAHSESGSLKEGTRAILAHLERCPEHEIPQNRLSKYVSTPYGIITRRNNIPLSEK